jgi:uncharacterized protein (DUF1501 family)
MQQIVSATRGGHVFEADLAAVAARSIDAETTLRTSLKAPSDPLFGTASASGSYNASADPKLQYDNPPTGAKTFSGLAQQLRMVARMIDASSAAGIGAKRQVFFVSLADFDMHDNENRTHADLMARLAHAMRYFDTTLGAMGAQSKVTTAALRETHDLSNARAGRSLIGGPIEGCRTREGKQHVPEELAAQCTENYFLDDSQMDEAGHVALP